MPYRIVQSKQNSRLKELRRALTHPARETTSLAGIEGLKLLEEALRAGLRVATVFVAQGFESLLDDLQLPSETEILLLTKELLDSALTTEAPQPIAALIEPPQWSWPNLLGGEKQPALILVLAGLQDPGNLGTILRSAEAFDTTGVIALPGTVNAWNPKAVRASAGSVFRVPLLAMSVKECFDRLRESEIKIWTTDVNDAQPAPQVDLAAPVALLIGNEGNGVPADLAARAAGAITIPYPGPVESLNAAVAASVLLYEASRQRHLPCGGPSQSSGGKQ
jgi:TrmH family RNA methyltransferase